MKRYIYYKINGDTTFEQCHRFKIKKMKPIIDAIDFLKLENKKNIVIIDVRVGVNAKSSFENLHLKRAFWVDAETELAQKTDNAAYGGRHPLPTVDKFCVLLGNLGINPSTHVIVYDDKNGANAAARFWWMLKAVGHEKVQVVNGGLQTAIKIGYPTSTEIIKPEMQPPYPAPSWQLPTADIEEVAKAALAPDHVVIDVRDSERYLGMHEPIDLIAGHIPGAINIPFNETDTVNMVKFFRSRHICRFTFGRAGNDYFQWKTPDPCCLGGNSIIFLLSFAFDLEMCCLF